MRNIMFQSAGAGPPGFDAAAAIGLDGVPYSNRHVDDLPGPKGELDFVGQILDCSFAIEHENRVLRTLVHVRNVPFARLHVYIVHVGRLASSPGPNYQPRIGGNHRHHAIRLIDVERVDGHLAVLEVAIHGRISRAWASNQLDPFIAGHEGVWGPRVDEGHGADNQI